jgi:hypothetical protein
VDDVVEVAIRKREAANISREKIQGRVGGKMRALHRERSGVAREDQSLRVKIKRPVNVRKALEQPTAEEAGATCNEDALVSHLLPERSRFVEDMVKIGGGQRLLYHRLDQPFSQMSG